MPSTPAQNADIECFNRAFQEDVLGVYLFTSLQEARDITEEWINTYEDSNS